MTNEQTLPGLEGAIEEMESNALKETEVDKLPTYTAERVANYEPKRYELAARLLFAENISRRTICKWLHMSPNTLSAIEVRELRMNPKRVENLKKEAEAEIEQIKRMGREALRARFFDKTAMDKTSTKDIASILKIMNDMTNGTGQNNNTNRNEEENEYIEAIAEWTEDGFGKEKNSAPEINDRLEVEAPKIHPSADKNQHPSTEQHGCKK